MPYKNIEDKRRYNRERMRRIREEKKRKQALEDAKKYVFGAEQKPIAKPTFNEWLKETYPNGIPETMTKPEAFKEYQDDISTYGVLSGGFFAGEIPAHILLMPSDHKYQRWCACTRCSLIRKINKNYVEEM